MPIICQFKAEGRKICKDCIKLRLRSLTSLNERGMFMLEGFTHSALHCDHAMKDVNWHRVFHQLTMVRNGAYPNDDMGQL